MTDLAAIHEAVMLAHHEVLEDPRYEVEGLSGASCGPHVKHVVQLAIHAASEGATADAWRAGTIAEFGPDVTPLVDEAQACMHTAGLWPWPGQG